MRPSHESLIKSLTGRPWDVSRCKNNDGHNLPLEAGHRGWNCSWKYLGIFLDWLPEVMTTLTWRNEFPVNPNVHLNGFHVSSHFNKLHTHLGSAFTSNLAGDMENSEHADLSAEILRRLISSRNLPWNFDKCQCRSRSYPEHSSCRHLWCWFEDLRSRGSSHFLLPKSLAQVRHPNQGAACDWAIIVSLWTICYASFQRQTRTSNLGESPSVSMSKASHDKVVWIINWTDGPCA